MKVFLLSCLTIVCCGIFLGHAAEFDSTKTAHSVSIINLIATPEKYNGKTVLVDGFLNLDFEDNALYLHSEDYERALTVNSIIIKVKDDPELKKLDKKYVIIQGVFRSLGDLRYYRGHGYIENIERIAERKGEYRVWKPKVP